MKTKIIYVLTSDENDSYLEQTYLSIWTLKRHNADAHVCLLTDNRTVLTLKGARSSILELLSEKVVVDFDDSVTNMKRSRLLKTSMRNLIDGDFLYIDGDTLITDSLAEIDDMEMEIGAVEDSHRPLAHHFGLEKLQRQAKVLGFDCNNEKYYYNSGVMLLKDNKKVRDFFSAWHDNWKKSSSLGINLDQPALIKTNIALGHPIQRMDGRWNCQLMYGLNYYKDAKIIHYFASRYTSTNGGFIHELMNPIFFIPIKRDGNITPDIAEKVAKPLSLFTDRIEIIGDIDTEIINTHVYKLVRSIYLSYPSLFSTMQKILFRFNKMAKKWKGK